MAAFAFHVTMDALQRERSAFVVIEQRRFPLGAVVTIGAGCGRALGELPAVNVFVTVLALVRRGFEIHVEQAGFQIWRLMAVDTSGGPVRPNQRE